LLEELDAPNPALVQPEPPAFVSTPTTTTPPRPPTDAEVARARQDLVGALRRAGVEDFLVAAQAEHDDVEDLDPMNDGGEPTGLFDALAETVEALPEPETAHAEHDDDPFLAELRRAMTDTEPLGPRDDDAPPVIDRDDEHVAPGRFRRRRSR
jgi:hypothetical protein